MATLFRGYGGVLAGPAAGRPQVLTDIDAGEMILMLAPQTDGATKSNLFGDAKRMPGKPFMEVPL